MKVNQAIQFNRVDKPTFKGIRLYKLNLLQHMQNGEDRFVPAYFTQIDQTDISTLKQIHPLWSTTHVGKQILTGIFNKIDDLTRKNKFFMIECPQFSNIEEKIRALSSVYIPNKIFADLHLQLLQSSSQLNLNQLKGSGTAMLRGLCRYAKDQKNINSIELTAKRTATGFYEKQNFHKRESLYYPFFTLPRSDFDDYLSRTSNTFGEIKEL